MAPKPHSQTVRGTISNPKTQEAMRSDKPTPRLGDATSLKPANDDKKLPSNDSAPPRGEGNDTDSKSSAPTVSEASGTKKKEDLPHSKKVRGTLANDDGNKVNKTQLGDPASLTSETSDSAMERGVEREGANKGGKSKL
jgi:hypothetical protein